VSGVSPPPMAELNLGDSLFVGGVRCDNLFILQYFHELSLVKQRITKRHNSVRNLSVNYLFFDDSKNKQLLPICIIDINLTLLVIYKHQYLLFSCRVRVQKMLLQTLF
jgi:hypothetical protein